MIAQYLKINTVCGDGGATCPKKREDGVVLVGHSRTKQIVLGNLPGNSPGIKTALCRLVFVIGGPYGFSDAVYQRANEKISLSRMTFSHQMVRLIFTEQLYRACTIIKGESYHHE